MGTFQFLLVPIYLYCFIDVATATTIVKDYNELLEIGTNNDRYLKQTILVITEPNCKWQWDDRDVVTLKQNEDLFLYALSSDSASFREPFALPSRGCGYVVMVKKGASTSGPERGMGVTVLIEPGPLALGQHSRIEGGFFNGHYETVSVKWYDPDTGLEHQNVELRTGGLEWIGTSLGHVFHVYEKSSARLLTTCQFGHAGVCVIRPHVEEAGGSCMAVVEGKEGYPGTDGHGQWEWTCEEHPDWHQKRLGMVKNWDHVYRRQNATDRERIRHNKEHPSIVPHFTEVGFEKVRTPPDVWEMIQTYYHANKEHTALEVWDDSNTYTNHFESPTYMIHLPENGRMKPEIFRRLQPYLEEWSGVDELEGTACYGIRVYQEGAELRGHVDRISTHAISVIINVDQDVEEPWYLHIYDHSGSAHNVTMAPGDMVLYESASCQHGRPFPLKGNYYTNTFVHYRPKDPALWADHFPGDHV